LHQTKRHVRATARLALVCGVVLVSTLLSPFSSPGAQAAAPTSTVLPLERAHDVVATRDRVFVSGGAASTSVAVTSATGTVTDVLGELPGPTDLLLSNDQSTLYVALPNANQIAAFDTGSLRESARYSTGTAACPSSLALAGRRLYFGYGCDQWGGNIGVVDLSRQPAVVGTGLVSQDFHDYPLLATTPAAPTVLIAGQPSLSPASVYAYSVDTGGALTFQRRSDHSATGSNLRDLALSRDGTTVYLAQGWPYGIQAFAVADMSAQSQFIPTTAYPNAVEVSRDGTRIAAGSDATYDPDVFLLRPDGIQVGSFELGENLVSGALAWAPGGGRLYAVSQHWSGGAPSLHVLPAPAA
jgi:sugar lactone lactonase YvrE